jgi:nucleoid DNA-binding protein
MKKKINKNEFLESIAERYEMPLSDVRKIYDAIVDELKAVVCSGQDLSLTGFGTFSLKKHKGHPVQFESKADTVEDYVVLKFTASDVLITNIRDAYSQGNAKASGEQH